MTLLIVGLILYFVPAVVATCRGHHNQGAIFALNLLLGWTLLGWVAAFVWACTNAGQKEKPSRTGLLVTRDDYRREHIQQQRENEAKEREKAKWARMSSDPWAQATVVQKPRQRDLVGPIVIGGVAVAVALMIMGYYGYALKHPSATTTVDTPASFPKPQSTVIEGLTPEQIQLLKARRDAMALPVAEPLHKKKKWAE